MIPSVLTGSRPTAPVPPPAGNPDSLLARLLECICSATSVSGFADEILSLMLEFTEADNCSLLLWHEQNSELCLAAASGRVPAARASSSRTFRSGEGVAGWVAEHRVSLRLDDVTDDLRFLAIPSSLVSVRSILCVPLIWHGRLIGVLNLSSGTPRALSASDESQLQEAAPPIAGTLVQLGNVDRLRESNQRLEAELAEKQLELERRAPLATAGHVLAGVVHELNNPLTTIRGLSELLQGAAGQSVRQAGLARTIAGEAERCARIVRSVLDLARPRASEVRSLPADDVVRKTVELAGYELRLHACRLELDAGAGECWVRVVESEFVQVLMNLIQNALHAVSTLPAGSGVVRVTTRAFHDEVHVDVSDNGPGVPEAIRSKIFEPMFTTKADGHGIGLSLARELIRGVGGDLRLLQLEGAGAVFRVSVLRASEPIGGTAPAEPGLAVPGVAQKTVLVVDDEDTLAELIESALQKAGYLAVHVTDGAAALEEITRADYDLLVSDLHMPGVSGLDLIGHLKQLGKTTRTLLLSGDVAGPSVFDPVSTPDVAYLAKPFSIAELVQAVAGLNE